MVSDVAWPPSRWLGTFATRLGLRSCDSLNGSGYDHDGPRVSVEGVDLANVATSEVPGRPGEHRIIIDIDLHAWLFESTTPGHHHLVIDKPVTFEQYLAVLKSLADCGVVEAGYVAATERRGYGSMRLPWVKKGAHE